MPAPDFGRLIRSRPIWFDLCEADENRFRLYVDRINHGLFADDPLDPDDDEDMAVAIMGLATYALHLDETEHGLAGTAFGDVIPKEQADERVQRLRERGRP